MKKKIKLHRRCILCKFKFDIFFFSKTNIIKYIYTLFGEKENKIKLGSQNG